MSEKSQISLFSNPAKQIVPCQRAAKVITVEWSNHRIFSADSKLTLGVKRLIYHSVSNAKFLWPDRFRIHVFHPNTNEILK